MAVDLFGEPDDEGPKRKKWLGYNESTPLRELREWLRRRIKKGCNCPLCEQHAQQFNRTLNKVMVNALAMLYRAGAHKDWVHAPKLFQNHASESKQFMKMAYPGILAHNKERRPDGGQSGWWMITPLGVEFLFGRAKVWKTSVVYDGNVMFYLGPKIDITQVDKEFRWDVLMGGGTCEDPDKEDDEDDDDGGDDGPVMN